jgi:hypothetical protein
MKDSFWLLLWKVFAIGTLSAGQCKQIGIRRGATSFNMRTVFVKPNGNFEKSQGLKGQTEK